MRLPVVVVLTILAAGCRHSFSKAEALAAIERDETFHRLLEPSTERVAHETVADCRGIYSDNPSEAQMAGDSAWIILSTIGWMDLADVDAPSDPRHKKHCRAVLTSKADKSAFQQGPDSIKTPWTSYWIVSTAHTKAEVVEVPEDSTTSSSAVADFQLTRERTTVGEILRQPRWSEEDGRLLTATLTGHFRWADGGWRLETYDEKK